MKASEVIEDLQNMIKLHGDLECGIYDHCDYLVYISDIECGVDDILDIDNKEKMFKLIG